MWTRAELKGKAKSVLKTNYWYCFLAALIVDLISSILNYVVSFMWGGPKYNGDFSEYISQISDTASKGSPFSLIVTIFLLYPLSVGLVYYFMRIRETHGVNISKIFYSFNNKNYTGVVGSMAWKLLFNFLWFIIPIAGIVLGIIKSIAYSMTEFILTDNANIGYKRALKLSIAMTDGYKGQIFVLWLSFIGWAILATIPFGLGWPFLIPYIKSTFAELYIKLRENALEKGICTYEELNLTAPQSNAAI